MSWSRYELQKIRDLVRAGSLNTFHFSRSWKDREGLAAKRERRLRKLLQYAAKHSRFYAQHFRGLDLARLPLVDLPILTKAAMLDNYDELVTDPQLKRQDLEKHLQEMTHDCYYRNRFKVFRSGGSSGNPAIMAYNSAEYCVVLAQVLRSAKNAVRMKFGRRLRGANVYARTPTHDSIRISQSFQIGLHEVRDFAVDLPVDKLVTELNVYQPDVLSGYPSAIVELAHAKKQGHLSISPQAIFLGSEPLTPVMRTAIREAFLVEPHDHYGTTEAIVMASECPDHRGMHLHDDVHWIEIVDRQGRPVGPGEEGHHVLVTNLYAFSQPIIRYELNDMLLLHRDSAPCSCGIQTRRIERVIGRNEDIFYFRAANGQTVVVHPEDLRNAMAECPNVRQFQIIRHKDELAVKTILHRPEEANRTRDDVIKKISALLERVQVKATRISCQITENLSRNERACQKFRQIYQVE